MPSANFKSGHPRYPRDEDGNTISPGDFDFELAAARMIENGESLKGKITPEILRHVREPHPAYLHLFPEKEAELEAKKAKRKRGRPKKNPGGKEIYQNNTYITEDIQPLEEPDPTERRNVYGLDFPKEYSQYAIEKYCFRNHHTKEAGGLGQYGHFRNAILLAFPGQAFKWNAYADRMVRAFCDNDLVNVWGSGGVGKSTTAAAISVVYWDCAPKETIITLYTSSISKHDLRAFGEIARLFNALKRRYPDTPGRYVESQHKIVYDNPEDEHDVKKAAGIFAFGTANRDDRMKVNSQSGVHNTYNMRVIDEWNACDPAIMKNLANMFQGGEDHKVFGMANPDSWDDLHGMHSIPVEGIDSVTPDTPSWTSTTGFHVIFLNGLTNPRLTEPDGDKKFPFFPGKAGIEKTRNMFGENSLEWWQQVVGFMPPSKLTSDTVLTRPLVEELRIQEPAKGATRIARVAGFDPASTEGGDAKVITFADILEDGMGKQVVQPYKQVSIRVDVDKRKDFILAMCRKVIELCKEEGVPKKHLAVDISGTDGCADSIDVLWKAKKAEHVHRVYFTGPATDRRMSEEDDRSSKDVFDRRVSELWMMVKFFAMAGQIRCIPEAALTQFCIRRMGRKYKKYAIEPKKDMRGGSPNEADSVVVLIDLAREVFGIDPLTPMVEYSTEDEAWRAHIRDRWGACPESENYYKDPFADLTSEDAYGEEHYH